jgi:hypothetical protein
LTSSLIRGAFITLSVWSASACGGVAQQHGPPGPLPGWTQPAKPTDKPLQSVALMEAKLIATVPNSIALQGHPGRAVVRDSATWQRIWNDVHSGSSNPPLREVNFGRDMVLAVAADLRGLDSLAVDTVARSSEGMVAIVTIEHKCAPFNDFFSPALLLLVPRSSSVTFVERRRGAGC